MEQKPLTITVNSNGDLLTYKDGSLNGLYFLVNKSKAHTGLKTKLQFGNQLVTASLLPDNPYGVLAALFSINPARTTLIDAPQEIKTWLENNPLKV